MRDVAAILDREDVSNASLRGGFNDGFSGSGTAVKWSARTRASMPVRAEERNAVSV